MILKLLRFFEKGFFWGAHQKYLVCCSSYRLWAAKKRKLVMVCCIEMVSIINTHTHTHIYTYTYQFYIVCQELRLWYMSTIMRSVWHIFNMYMLSLSCKCTLIYTISVYVYNMHRFGMSNATHWSRNECQNIGDVHGFWYTKPPQDCLHKYIEPSL
jgi:hypothetical protein